MTREEASTLFKENDKDKDGFISLEEYFGKERYHADTERERERCQKKNTHVYNDSPPGSFLPFLCSSPPTR